MIFSSESSFPYFLTIVRCIQLLRDDKASVAIFPEGGIHDDRKFYPLKAGCFKIATKADVPIVVCTLLGTNHIIKNALRLKPSDVRLRLLEVIPAEELAGKTTVDIAQRVRGIMLADLAEKYPGCREGRVALRGVEGQGPSPSETPTPQREIAPRAFRGISDSAETARTAAKERTAVPTPHHRKGNALPSPATKTPD